MFQMDVHGPPCKMRCNPGIVEKRTVVLWLDQISIGSPACLPDPQGPLHEYYVAYIGIWPVLPAETHPVPAQRKHRFFDLASAYPYRQCEKQSFPLYAGLSPIHIWHDLPFSLKEQKKSPVHFQIGRLVWGSPCQMAPWQKSSLPEAPLHPPASAIHRNPPLEPR